MRAHRNHRDSTEGRSHRFQRAKSLPGDASLHSSPDALTIGSMKATSKKKASARGSGKYKRPASLGRSPVTGARVLKPVVRGASISLDDVRRVVRTLKPLAID